MFTSIDKALVSAIMAGLFLWNTFAPWRIDIDPNTVAAIIGGLTPILVYLVPNKRT